LLAWAGVHFPGHWCVDIQRRAQDSAQERAFDRHRFSEPLLSFCATFMLRGVIATAAAASPVTSQERLIDLQRLQ